MIPLIEAGVITAAAKRFCPARSLLVSCWALEKLFNYVSNNPLFELRPNAFTNDPHQIARNDNMVAINSALQDRHYRPSLLRLHRTDFYSGIGGQVDFLRGASRSKGGKPIIALPSTAKKGHCHESCHELNPGAGVVTSRGLIRYVVTEYGVAYLHGKTIRERAEALIQIAHPSFRNGLYDYCERTKWLHRPSLAAAR